MKFLFLWFLVLIKSELSAQPLNLEKPKNTELNQQFALLEQYRNLSFINNELTDTSNALLALFDVFTPTLKSFAHYTGLFTGNCSVFFEDVIYAAHCDITPVTSTNITLEGKVTPKVRLPEQYWHQITLSNILLTQIFAD
jgi:hypothetical protein